MEEDIQVENEKPEEKMATLATEEVEPNGKTWLLIETSGGPIKNLFW